MYFSDPVAVKTFVIINKEKNSNNAFNYSNKKKEKNSHLLNGWIFSLFGMN
jgi:hypothetical protein